MNRPAGNRPFLLLVAVTFAVLPSLVSAEPPPKPDDNNAQCLKQEQCEFLWRNNVTNSVVLFDLSPACDPSGVGYSVSDLAGRPV